MLDSLTEQARAYDPCPPLFGEGLWPNQRRGVEKLEESLKADRPRALIQVQMATGSGRTILAVTAAYRLIKFGGARRILFLVDRTNLGQQAEKEFPELPNAGQQAEVHGAIQRATPRREHDWLVCQGRHCQGGRRMGRTIGNLLRGCAKHRLQGPIPTKQFQVDLHFHRAVEISFLRKRAARSESIRLASLRPCAGKLAHYEHGSLCQL